MDIFQISTGEILYNIANKKLAVISNGCAIVETTRQGFGTKKANPINENVKAREMIMQSGEGIYHVL